MAQGGYILLNRSIQDHWLWNDEPYDKARAFIDLIFLANYEDKKAKLGSQIVVCKRGDVNLSIKYLAKRWGWSRHKVSDFLDLLEKDSIIVQKRTPSRTVISIVKYDVYQLSPSIAKDIERASVGTQKGHHKDTTNKVNKNKKINKFNEMIHTNYDMEEIERTLNET